MLNADGCKTKKGVRVELYSAEAWVFNFYRKILHVSHHRPRVHSGPLRLAKA
jgi:hypothetical protein